MKAIIAVVVVCAWMGTDAVIPGLAPHAYARPIDLARGATAAGKDSDPKSQYYYAYEIHDALNGDTKSQQEMRSGDVMLGWYSVVDPNGVRLVIEYSADPLIEFNAYVPGEPVGKGVAKAATPVAVTQAHPH